MREKALRSVRGAQIRSTSRRLCATALWAALAAGVLAAPAGANTISPNTTADQDNTDASHCSLREAVTAANTDAAYGGCTAGSGSDTIALSAGTFLLSLLGVDDTNAGGDLDITAGTATISNTGNGRTVIDGGGLDAVIQFGITATSGAISGVTVTGGNALIGGGVETSVPLTISNTAISGNEAGFQGGGLAVYNDAEVILSNVTVSDNTADEEGGGIYIDTGAVKLNNSTVTGNTTDSDDTGGNDDGGGIFGFAGASTVHNSIIAGNTDASTSSTVAPDCGGGFTLTSLGASLIGSTGNCPYTAGTGDILNTTAGLEPLADNGGSTFTHALLATSQALNKGGSGCATNDQRGVPRSLGGQCDIGAYELVRCRGVLVGLVGTTGADALSGGGSADGAVGLGGNDTLTGGGGADGLCGGDGKDKLTGGKGKDRLDGGKGRDRLNGGAGRDRLFGGGGRDRCIGGSGRDKGKRCEIRRRIP